MSSKLIVGLGNPGAKYDRSRHNVGFMAVDFFAKKHKLIFAPTKFKGEAAKGAINGHDFYVLKPTTFMNNSGQSVVEFVNYHNIRLDDIIVAYDDMDIPLGSVRIREDGSSGGQNGMLSVTQQLGTQAVKRIRIGIGRPQRTFDTDFVVDHVLQPFDPAEKVVIAQSLAKVEQVLVDFLELPFTTVMSKHNKAKP